MIRFDASKLEIKLMHVKMISGALGGTLTVLDEKRSKKAKKEVFTRIKIAHQLTRYWNKMYRGANKYIKPVLTAVTFYDGHVVALERHPLGNLGKEKTEGLFGDVTWSPDTERNITTIIKPLAMSGDWYIDGTYIYNLQQANLNAARRLSGDGKFREVRVDAIKLSTLPDEPAVESRVCLAFYPTNGKMALTPPIWKTLHNVGQRQLTAKGSSTRDNEEVDDDETVTYMGTEEDTHQFDEIDDHLCVNLGFVLKAGRELSEVFGYDAIEPLGLDDMMIQLRTVNLPTVASEVKSTFDTGMKFTIAVAWLIGLVKKTETLDSYITLRSLLKYLTTKGVYRKGAFTENAIFKAGSSLTNIKMLSIAEAHEAVKGLSLDAFLAASRLAREGEDADNEHTEDLGEDNVE